MPEYREYYDPLLDEAAASLLYFPTGGGKSEAFYGTLLFAMFLDRLRGKTRGVTAMIRYPLRLLTLQQGQRLLKLITHAELVRAEAEIHGWPFEIGFWVGGNNTPNRYAQVPRIVPLDDDTAHPNDERLEEGVGGLDEEEQRDATRYREFRAAYNKLPQCPVCDGDTGLRRFESDGPTARRLGIVCFTPQCDFNRAHPIRTPLPFLLTDDAIYARAPSIVLGTVDKLAMLGQSTTTIRQLMGMFGLARGVGPTGHLISPPNEGDIAAWLAERGHQPVAPAFQSGQPVFFDPFPALIIQDEAHLLEESLGTFSGLFDSLLDHLFREIGALAGDALNVARVGSGDRPDRFNSMFFAGLPSDIAEYIQASSRVGRTHVGFVMLIPTPQSRRDRYVVETHDIFHRFLERMIAPPAVERWAENAIRRVMASVVQAWAILRENQAFVHAADNAKSRTDCFETIVPKLNNQAPVFADSQQSFSRRSWAVTAAQVSAEPPSITS
jgi:hypothetical protein